MAKLTCSYRYRLKMSKIRKKFAQRLKATRLDKGLTQEGLAEILGISVRYIQLLESKSPPNVKLDTLEDLAKALKVKASDLIS
jgi:transcriptional regulator with XRE-family HTH domain